MWPILFKIGGLTIGTYGLCMAIGFLWGWRFGRIGCMRRGWNPEYSYSIIVTSMIAGIIGARLFHVIDHWDSFKDDLGRIFTANSGLTWYGGLIFAILACIWVSKRYGYKFIAGLDMAAPMLASGYAWGRVGCLLAGDGCYGIEATGAWSWLGMTFPDGLVPTTVPVHPTMIYEFVFNFALFGVLWWVDARKTVPDRWPHGMLFAIFAVFHSLERLLVEFIRLNDRYWFTGDGWGKVDYFGGEFGLSFSQFISIGGIVLGIAIVVFLVKRGKKAEPFPIQTGDAWTPEKADEDKAGKGGKPKKKSKKK